jgi:adenylate cyclase
MAAQRSIQEVKERPVDASDGSRLYDRRVRQLGSEGVAVAAGTTVETVEELCGHGVLATLEDGSFRPSDVRRARLALALQTSGVPFEAIGKAIQSGRISFEFIDDLAPEPIPLLPETQRELVDRLGISAELARGLGTILGTCSLPGDSQVRSDHAELFEVVAAAKAEGASDEWVVRVIRATADSMRRVVEVQQDFADGVLMQPLADSGASPSEVLAASAAARRRYRELGRRTVDLLLDRFADEAVFQNIVEQMETALAEERVAAHGALPAIAFMDISGYTRLVEEAGDEEGVTQVARFIEIVEAVMSDSGGRLVKVLGDGVMMHFASADAAIQAALRLLARVLAGDLPPARAGINAGPMVRRDGDYFGSVVNLAARAADYARPYEILVTQEVVNAWIGGSSVQFRAIGAVALKNVKRRVELYQVLPEA